jgi:hypothetical protein
MTQPQGTFSPRTLGWVLSWYNFSNCRGSTFRMLGCQLKAYFLWENFFLNLYTEAFILLKGQCHKIFDPHQTIPPRALTHGLKPFRIWLRIRRENQHYSSFSCVNDTAETVSAVSMATLKSFLRCHWHRWNFRPDPHSCFSCVIDTAETIMIVKFKIS